MQEFRAGSECENGTGIERVKKHAERVIAFVMFPRAAPMHALPNLFNQHQTALVGGAPC